MGEVAGVLAAALSSAFGGTSIGATRFLVGVLDPLAIGAFRFGVGSALLIPFALATGRRWPARHDLPATAALGLLFFFVFPILFNASVIFTTAARAGLALSTLPLLTLAIAAALGVERMTARKTLGVLVAMSGVAFALLAGLDAAPTGAWRGDLLMVAAAVCMALYGIWSKPLLARTDPVTFTATGMVVGAAALAAVSLLRGSFAPVAVFAAPQWAAVGYLGGVGAALTFFLWAFALRRTTPTLVAVSITVNPIAAASTGALILGEPIGANVAVGVAAVLTGIVLATRGR